MSGNLQICLISKDLEQKLKEFRFKKSQTSTALILKITKDTQSVDIEEEFEDCTVDQIRDALPDTLPRFVVISYRLEHSDGRVSFPLCFIYVSPQGCNPELQMLYAGSKNSLVKELGSSKDFELRDVDELTDEYLLEKLGIKK